MHTIILYNPQIPQNTGNIVRTCRATGANLVLVKPLGFSIDNKSLRRAGLDYWSGVNVTIIDNLIDHLKKESRPFYFFSSKSQTIYSDIKFDNDAIFIFGSETNGLPADYNNLWPEKFLTIPMTIGNRCLNLSNAVSITLYEASRQSGFSFLKTGIGKSTVGS